MIFSIHEPLNDVTKHCIHHINVLDHNGEPVGKVQTFNTETYECTYKPEEAEGRPTQAAGFCFIAGTKAQQDNMLAHLPPDLREHVIVLPDEAFLDEDVQMAFLKQWVEDFKKGRAGR